MLAAKDCRIANYSLKVNYRGSALIAEVLYLSDC